MPYVWILTDPANWKTTFLNRQGYLNTKWILDDIKELLLIWLDLVIVFFFFSGHSFLNLFFYFYFFVTFLKIILILF